MKNNSIATINASTLAPLCRNLNNKARKQTKVTEAKMVTPINGITSPKPNIAVHRQPVGAPVFSRNCVKDNDQYLGNSSSGTSGVSTPKIYKINPIIIVSKPKLLM